MAALEACDREVLTLRYLERLSFDQISGLLGIGLSAAKMRHLRAIERLLRAAGGVRRGAPARTVSISTTEHPDSACDPLAEQAAELADRIVGGAVAGSMPGGAGVSADVDRALQELEPAMRLLANFGENPLPNPPALGIPASGMMLGDFEIGRGDRRGGHGVVYEATQRWGGRSR